MHERNFFNKKEIFHVLSEIYLNFVPFCVLVIFQKNIIMYRKFIFIGHELLSHCHNTNWQTAKQIYGAIVDA